MGTLIKKLGFLRSAFFAVVFFQGFLVDAEILPIGSTIDPGSYESYFQINSRPVGSTYYLLDLTQIKSKLPRPPVPYNREQQFGAWRKDPTGRSCLDTRGEVLRVQSRSPVKTEQGLDKCFVSKGQWLDPYTGGIVADPAQLQIDHVVPLKNAYTMGGWRWNSQLRCTYANFMGSGYHLLAVSAHENMSKGDATPYDYMPPDSRFACSYLQIWLKIKLAWNLALLPPEVEAIKSLAAQNNCSSGFFQMGADELAQVRRAMQNNSRCN